MNWVITSVCLLVFSTHSVAAQSAGVQSSSDLGARRAADLFLKACVSTRGDAQLAYSAAQKFSPHATALQSMSIAGRSGLGTNIFENGTPLTLMLEPTGMCHVVSGMIDNSHMLPILESALKRGRELIVETHTVVDTEMQLTRSYRLSSSGPGFNVIASINKRPNAIVNTMLTLSR